MTRREVSMSSVCATARAETGYQPEPPPPPPPPPEEPPPLLPPELLEPGATDDVAILCDSSPPIWSAKPTGSARQSRSESYQSCIAAPAPAAASTPAKRLAHAFCTSSAI